MRLGTKFRGRDPCLQCPHCLCHNLADSLDIILSRASRHELFRNTVAPHAVHRENGFEHRERCVDVQLDQRWVLTCETETLDSLD